MTERLITAREVGELVGLSTETILRRYRSGEIPGFRLSSNVLRFAPAEIDAWLASCTRWPCAEPPEVLQSEAT